MRISLLVLIVALIPGAALRASEGINGAEVKAQIWAEQGLRQNEEYLKILNPAVSNYGTPSEKAAFKRAVNHQVQAKILFLAFQFGEAYAEVRRTQYLLIQIYGDIVEKSREEVLQRLNQYAGRIVHSRDVTRKKYLTLGLRDLESARLKVQTQYNMRQWLFILRLNELAEALKLTRQASRFAILLTIEFESVYPRDPSEKQTYSDLAGVINSGFPTKRGELQLRHNDNFFKVGADSKDLLEEFWTNPELSILKKPLTGWDDEPAKDPPSRI